MLDLIVFLFWVSSSPFLIRLVSLFLSSSLSKTGAAIILILSLSIHLQVRPYDSTGHDKMESFSIHASLLILMMVLLASIVGQDIKGKLGPISSIGLIVIVFGSTFVFFFVAAKEVMQHSHDHEGLIGKMARLVSKPVRNDRRHSTFRQVPLDLDDDDDRQGHGPQGTIGIGGNKIVPRSLQDMRCAKYKHNNKVQVKRSLTLHDMRRATIHATAEKIEKSSAQHLNAFRNAQTQKSKSAKTRTMARLKTRLSQKAQKAKKAERKRKKAEKRKQQEAAAASRKEQGSQMMLERAIFASTEI